MKVRWMALLWLVSAFVITAQGVEESLRDDLERYTKFPLRDIEELAQDIDFDPRGVVDTLTSDLTTFYLSDPSRKKIEQRQLLEGDESIFVKEWNVNIQRLLLKDLLSKPQSSFLIKEAPNIFLMHSTLARAFMRQKKIYHAAYHFASALRFRTLRLETNVYTDKDRLALLNPDDPQIAAANHYREVTSRLAEAKANEKRTEISLFTTEDNLRAQKNSNDAALQNVIQENRRLLNDQLARNRELLAKQKGDLAELEADMAQAQEQFEEYAVKYNEESSRLLVESADLIRQIEDALKERQKVINKKVLYKTEFNQTLLHDYSQNRQFTAYANLLEAASRLDERNPQISYKLAGEYASSQDIRRAIYAYEKALQANARSIPDNRLQETQLHTTQVALGSLYFQTNRMVDSAYYYEHALQTAADEPTRQNLTYQVARFHIERTGNFKRGIELLLPYKARLMQLNPTDTAGRLDWLKQRFQVSRLLATADEFTGDYIAQKDELDAAVAVHQELEKMINEQRAQIADLFKRLQEAKKPLLNETRVADYNEYRRLEDQHQSQRLVLDEMMALRNSLPLAPVYFALARAHESQHDIAGALAVYQQAEIQGISSDQARRFREDLKKRYP